MVIGVSADAMTHDSVKAIIRYIVDYKVRHAIFNFFGYNDFEFVFADRLKNSKWLTRSREIVSSLQGVKMPPRGVMENTCTCPLRVMMDELCARRLQCDRQILSGKQVRN